MPLNLYTSNRMEVLVDTLAAALREPLANDRKDVVSRIGKAEEGLGWNGS